jgi:FxsC-like protein
MPESISHIQYMDDLYPPEYRTEGLHVIARVGAYRDGYEIFKNRLARRIVDVAEECPLLPLFPHPDIKQTVSAFHRPGAQPPGLNGAPQTDSPRYVQFIFVAGKRGELEEIRHSTDCYGHEGRDWRPFLPEVTDEVWWLAQNIATQEKFEYETVPLDANVIDKLKEAERNRKIVVVIVDTWTLQLQQYREFMRPYDDLYLLNCVVLVPWNPQDNETQSSRSELEAKIRQTFPKKWRTRDQDRFLASINSLDELKKHLSEGLHKACALIRQNNEVVRPVETESTPMIPKPGIAGPGG